MTGIPQHMQQELAEVKSLTEEIRNHQRAIEDIAEERRDKILSLRAGRITYREIAASMGVTEQTVFKCLRPALQLKKEQAQQAQAT